MIYFIGCPAADAVKIGVTWNNPYSRLGQAQVNCPLDLELLATCVGGVNAERELHDRFADLRIRGEWFRLSDELRAHIQQFTRPEKLPRGWHGQQRNRRAAA